MVVCALPQEHRPRSPCPPRHPPGSGPLYVANRGYSKGQKRLPTGIFWTVLIGTRMGAYCVMWGKLTTSASSREQRRESSNQSSALRRLSARRQAAFVRAIDRPTWLYRLPDSEITESAIKCSRNF